MAKPQPEPELHFIAPMLPLLVTALPEGPDWSYELKLDGYRIQASKSGRKVELRSRSGANFTSRFPEAVAAISRVKHKKLLLDGEIVSSPCLPAFAQVTKICCLMRRARRDQLIYLCQLRRFWWSIAP